MNHQHIFIVGLGRTGSTLTRQLINSSECAGIAGESHYLSDLPRLGFRDNRGVRQLVNKIGDLATPEGTRKVVDYLFSINKRHLVFWNLSARGVSRDQFLELLLAVPASERERGLFDLAMEAHAGGKPVRGEKTPAHIFFVPQLIQWFPDAKIVHTFRDPRAIYMSRKKKAENKISPSSRSLTVRAGVFFQLISSLHVMTLWRRVERLHRQYLQQFPEQYTLLKYEDLVSEPRAELSKLCEFLGIPLVDAMLDQNVINSSFLPDGAAGFDTGSISRWRKQMDPTLQRWFRLWLGASLERYGYEQ